MRKLFKGFTLAEVLITLGIIGVIASVTLPNLSINIQKQQVAPALRKAINTLETTNKLVLQDNDIRRLDHYNSTQYLDQTLSNYIRWSKVSSPGYLAFNLKQSLGVNTNTVYVSPDGIGFFRAAAAPANVSGNLKNLPRSLAGQYYQVYVDTNGPSKKPNALGRDVYLLYVDMKGSVIPFGGNAYKEYSQGNTEEWRSKCYARSVSDAKACAGSVIDNGKVIHRF